MLGKLMKYDFRCMIRKFGPLWLGLLALAAVNGFTVGHVLDNDNVQGFMQFLLGVVPILLLFALWVATCVMMIMFVCERFYKGLLGDEGYLMFTLPATPAQHIGSKLIVAFVMELITGLVALGAMLTFVMVYDGAGFIQGLAEAKELLARWGELPRGTGGLIAQLFLLGIVSIVCTDLQIYLAFSLGHLAKKNRVAMSVIAYVGINVAISILLAALGRLVPSVNINVDIVDLHSAEAFLRTGMWAMWGLIAWQLIKGAAFFFGSDVILSKKLNLE